MTMKGREVLVTHSCLTLFDTTDCIICPWDSPGRNTEWPTQGDLPDPGIEPVSFESPILADGFLPLPPPGKANEVCVKLLTKDFLCQANSSK